MLQDYYTKVSGLRLLAIKAAVLAGFLLTTLYLVFRAYYINFTPVLVVFSLLLFLAELHTLILMYGFLYSLWPRKYKSYDRPNLDKNLRINLFVTCAGEPVEVVCDTIAHAKQAAVYYQNAVHPRHAPRVIVLNDGKARGIEGWQNIAHFCAQVGAYHLARPTNVGFKAGNINNGLKRFPSPDPHNTIDCFFDADFCAKPNFLIEILKPLADDSVDFVQSPQRYKNLNTWVAKAAGSHQIFFFDFICPAKAWDNALFLCGTNYAIRRTALLAAGGVDDRFVTEDYATSIRLHLNGNRGVFLPTVLAEGMAPMNLKEYFNQQTRWCKGCLDANGTYFRELFFGHLTLRQKFHYFLSTAYYFIGVRDLILVLAPLPYLFWGISLIRANTIAFLAFVYLPLIIYSFTLFFITFKNPVKSLVLDIVSFPVFAVAFLSNVLKRNLPFSITVKKYERENPFQVYKIQLAVALALIAGLLYSLFSHTHTPANAAGRAVNYFWAGYDALFLVIGFLLVVRENLRLPSFSLPRYVYAGVAFAASFVIISASSLAIPVIFDSAKSHYQDITTQAHLRVPDTGAYYGYYQPALNSHPAEPVVKLTTEDSPSLAMYYQDWTAASGFDTRFMQALYSQGVIPVITWEPTGLTPRQILSGSFDAYISAYAKGAAAYKKPFFLRFAHEMNGNWYTWTGDPVGYRKMWMHVHDLFVAAGAGNVLWVWSPNNTDQYGRTDSVMDYYPGDDYVDWVGFSAFNWDKPWKNFDQITFEIYYLRLAPLNKPVMVAETSSVSRGGDKADWFTETLGYISSMPHIKAVVFFDQDVKSADFSLDSGMDFPAVLRANILTNDYYLKQPLIDFR